MKKITLLISLMILQASGANSQTTFNNLNNSTRSSLVSENLEKGYLLYTAIVSDLYR